MSYRIIDLKRAPLHLVVRAFMDVFVDTPFFKAIYGGNRQAMLQVIRPTIEWCHTNRGGAIAMDAQKVAGFCLYFDYHLLAKNNKELYNLYFTIPESKTLNSKTYQEALTKYISTRPTMILVGYGVTDAYKNQNLELSLIMEVVKNPALRKFEIVYDSDDPQDNEILPACGFTGVEFLPGYKIWHLKRK